jgi:5'-methylthioadenosine phosphorylase
MTDIAIIGGSGVYNLEVAQVIEKKKITTPFGDPSGEVTKLKCDGGEFYFIPRHGFNHQFNPSEVNYRANVFALKKLGVKYIISISAVGSLKKELPPGSFVFPSDFIDWTKGIRPRSFYEKGVVGHTSCAEPIFWNLQETVHQVVKDNLKIKTQLGGTYICIEGPQFSSRAESRLYKGFGADVIGMTNVTEAYLAAEAGLGYTTIAMVTDYDSWSEEFCTVEEIMAVMKGNNQNIQAVLSKVVAQVHKQKAAYDFHPQNTYAVMTPKERWPEHLKSALETLLS